MKNEIVLFKALCSETRYRILRTLLSGEKCACELPQLIERTQSNTSMHLAMLLESAIVQQRREGKKIIYAIKDERIRKIFRVLDEGETMIDKKDETMCSVECSPNEEDNDTNDKNKDDDCECGGCC